MNEFIEKLIGRIMLESASCKVYKLINPNKEDIAEFNAYKKCIEIVNQLSEEYINTSTNSSSGWIPCSERLPDKEGAYLVTLKKWETITFARFTDIKTNPHFNALVIAWMPLPQPYTEEQKELSTT